MKGGDCVRKIFIMVCFFIVVLSTSALAANPFERVLSDKISEYGIFNGEKGIIYADAVELENKSLLIVSVEGSNITCEVYDDTDGLQLTDTLSLSCGGLRACRLVTVKSGGANYIMFSRMSENEFYTIENDAFITVTVGDYYPMTSIAASENGKIVPSVPSGAIYNTLNRLKEESIKGYPFTNRINSIADEERLKIKTTISACADVMRFDVKNYDYDTLFKYVLYTHENFRVLTDIDPKTGESSALGYNSVHLVSSEFIDYVMLNIFRVTPEKPPVNNLLSRGFCYNDGYYLYSGGFDVYFATDVNDIIGAYDLGGNVVFLIFSDMYYEGDTKIPEYSFAILQKTSGGYSVLRLGMGESLPTVEEVRAYSPFSVYGGSLWKGDTKTDGGGDTKTDLFYLLLLTIFSVGAVGLVCSVVVLIKTRR